MNLTFIFMLLLMMMPLLMSFMLLKLNLFMITKLFLINLSSINISIDMIMDWTSMMFLSTVMLISALIILFSKYYIPNQEQKQFLILLLMFVISMSILIISNNLFLILLGWDGLGFSSYMLVIYYQNSSSAASGTITLLSNRMGDILILLSMSLIMISSNWSFSMNLEYSSLTMIMLMIAACSKSAQFPFSAWLPMAMAAPTPISALVHSSTLVTAGVFLMLRIAPNFNSSSMTILLILSSLTAIYASMSANWEQDMKKIIALSTLSQIAMMMFAISLNSSILAFSHLIIHALFKSAMFLCAGIMIHESSYQDMRMMGLNFNNYSLILSMFGINSMALMGIPFMSGFFSKDMIIENMMMSSINSSMSFLMIMSIGMTAAYSLRMSFSSSKQNIKSNNLFTNHLSLSCMFPIMFLSLFAITSGSWLSWLTSPEQMFIINFSTKMMILLMLFMGLLLGTSLHFKAKKYMKLGLTSNSLWFSHFLSIIPTSMISPLMSIYHNNDKNWQEMYGPNNSFNMLSYMSMNPINLKSSLMMILIMLSFIPMYII
uniref:NADH-ubiquinone oxidoreductase chain 5 n=1 Tax=Epeus alboguttatus TaxID=2575944 RepID=A0A4P8DP95_9ARAC|nr:NADH dehydrogenase subunit 5 [Epeus alboguttatus]QCL18090.1 NADH dehydrogenase subunit 5 [Epeus alboguttatus]